MWFWLLAIVLVILGWTFQGQRSKIRRNGRRLPFPPGTLPIAGNGLWFLESRHKTLQWFAEMQPKMGVQTFEISVPSLPPAIVINDPRNVEHVLKNNDIFVKGDFFRTRSWDLFGNGIINADGELWKIQRKAGLRFFSNSNLKRLIDEDLPRLLEGTKEMLRKTATGGDVIDFQEVMLALTTRLMGKVAFDMDISSSHPFSTAFDYASGVTGTRFTNPFWKIKEVFLGSRFRRAVTEVKAFGRQVITSAKEKRATRPKSEKSSPLDSNLLDSLLDHIEDEQMVADSTMNFLSAGRDTTAQSITWTVYSIMRHPGSHQAIIEELSNAFPSLGPSSSLPLSHDTVQPLSLPVTYATFSETIRLYPPVPFELKESTVDSTFPDGTVLPRGSVVLWVPWALGRSPDIWGADAASFKPERWIIPSEGGDQGGASSISLLQKTAFENPVFNAGPRMCLGKKMAELLAVYVLAALLWEFEFEEVRGENGDGERVCGESLTLPMEGGLPCRVYLREDRQQNRSLEG